MQDGVELVVLVSLDDMGADLFEAMEDEAVEVEEVRDGDGVASRFEVGNVPEEETPSVSELTVGLDKSLLDLRSETGVLLVVEHGCPEPDDLGAAPLDDLAGVDDVAQGLRHRPPLIVEDEAVGDAGPERTAALGPDADEEGAVEPAAVLVVALDIDVGGPSVAALALKD